MDPDMAAASLNPNVLDKERVDVSEVLGFHWRVPADQWLLGLHNCAVLPRIYPDGSSAFQEER
jgi:hypothetical protein